jgi:hypothetical protein
LVALNAKLTHGEFDWNARAKNSDVVVASELVADEWSMMSSHRKPGLSAKTADFKCVPVFYLSTSFITSFITERAFDNLVDERLLSYLIQRAYLTHLNLVKS